MCSCDSCVFPRVLFFGWFWEWRVVTVFFVFQRCASDVFRVCFWCMCFGWLSGVEGLFRVCEVRGLRGEEREREV